MDLENGDQNQRMDDDLKVGPSQEIETPNTSLHHVVDVEETKQESIGETELQETPSMREDMKQFDSTDHPCQSLHSTDLPTSSFWGRLVLAVRGNQPEKAVRAEQVREMALNSTRLGKVVGDNRRSLLYHLLSIVTNGDKIADAKLNQMVSVEKNPTEYEDLVVSIDHRCLLDRRVHVNNILKDLLDLPRHVSSKVLHHPVIVTFIQERWKKTRYLFLWAFFTYLLFLILYSIFLGIMFLREDSMAVATRHVVLPPYDNLAKNTNTSWDKVKTAITEKMFFRVYKKKSRESEIRRRKNNNTKIFSVCLGGKFPDNPLCFVEISLTMVIGAMLVEKAWEGMALGLRYFGELENWVNILIMALAITSLNFEYEIRVLKIVASFGICLAWLELIFMLGRYPFFGGRFSIMFYSITKRIVQSVLAFVIMIIAFGFAFFIIHLGNDAEQFENPGKALLKIFVMVLGEFEFDELYANSNTNDTTMLVCTMLLLISLLVYGTVIMVNLIVAIIITDVNNLLKTSREQVLINQANHAIKTAALFHFIDVLKARFGFYSRKAEYSEGFEFEVCTHVCCNCKRRKVEDEVLTYLLRITNTFSGRKLLKRDTSPSLPNLNKLLKKQFKLDIAV